jgi:ABC-type branched-subunit amino acid transport system permease subunit
MMRWLVIALGVAALMMLPFGVSESTRHLMIVAFIYAMVAASWDLTLGYGGIFNFAHIAFFGLGAYAAALVAKVLGLSPRLGFPAGALIGAAAAALVTLPVLRLTGIYIVLVTFAFSQLCMQMILSNADVTGGMSGLVSIPSLKIGSYNLGRDGKMGVYFVALALLAGSVGMLWAIVRSNFGRALVALRDNADYAASRGVSEARHRLIAMIASGAVSGLAGALYALYLRVVSPDVFGFGISSLVLSMVLVGGVGSLFGPVLAALLITALSSGLTGYGAWRFVAIAVVLLAVIRFSPGGIWKIRKTFAR